MGGWNAGRTNGRRWRLYALVFPLAIVIALTGLEPVRGVAEVAAQERPRTVMDMLFGGRSSAREAPRAAPTKKRNARRKPQSRSARRAPAARSKPARVRSSKRSNSRRRTAKAAVQAPAAPVVVEKSSDARTVLVVGDFLADSLADGLQDSLADNRDVRIEERSNGSSGLVRQDYYDWLAEIGPMIDETKPAVVVVMIGSNDRQEIGSQSGTHALRSDAWAAEYSRRAEAFAAAVRAKNVPLVWIGLPAFKFDRMSEDMVFLNDLYRRAAASVSGEFVDIWDGFVDANGAFVYTGPDINGQPARLRNEDGITMTSAGEGKLAFFAEKSILRLLGNPGTPIASLPPEALTTMRLPPLGNAANARSVAPIALNDPALDGGDTLLGGSVGSQFTLEPSPRERLVLSGQPAAAVPGRANDFSWNSKAPAVSPSTQSSGVVVSGSVDLDAVVGSGTPTPPKEMPSLQDAIIEDWASQAAAPEGSGAPASPAEQRPPASLAAPAGPEAATR